MRLGSDILLHMEDTLTANVAVTDTGLDTKVAEEVGADNLPKGEIVPIEEVFEKEYKELCMKHKMEIACEPIFKLRDDGTFSIVLKFSIKPMP